MNEFIQYWNSLPQLSGEGFVESLYGAELLSADCGKGRVLLTVDEKMKRTISIARNVASTKATVLTQGGSGTGKELVASLIHSGSERRNNRLVAINCAALPETLLESELSGYERGAFTGAMASKEGKFETANHSTLLLDEISEMSINLQAKLLRVLQEEEIDRVGGKTPIPIDIRIIATTNRNLFATVREGNFRSDLYFRLNVIPLFVPTLAERPQDAYMLAHFFLKHYSKIHNRKVDGFSRQAIEILMSYRFEGNVRELENVIERAVLFSDKEIVRPEHLMLPEAMEESSPMVDAGGEKTVKNMERDLILNTLKSNGGNRTRAARMLGISVRTLRNKLNEYRLDNPALLAGV